MALVCLVADRNMEAAITGLLEVTLPVEAGARRRPRYTDGSRSVWTSAGEVR